jgi:hypothetical protein
MPKKKKVKDDTPPGGWMGPPPTYGIAALGHWISKGKGKSTKTTFVKARLSKKDKKKRKIWEKAVKKADKKGEWWFPNPFKKKKKGKKK